MKVLFLNPPTFENSSGFFRPVRFPTYNYATPVMHPPIYLAYATSYVRSRGHDVYLIDAPLSGMSVLEFIDKAASIRPDIAVFETSTPSFSNDVEVARLVKERIEGVKVVFLGTHVSSLKDKAFEGISHVDAGVTGEYEFALSDYIENGPAGVKGLVWNDGSKWVVNEPREWSDSLDDLPFPARDLLDNYRYFDPILKNPFTFIVSGRGCPYGCSFCNWPIYLTGRRLRKRSAENILDEIKHIADNYEFKSFLFNDDTFTADKSHALRIAEMIMERGIKVKWGCYARADFDDVEVLKTMKKSGAFLLKIGIETSDRKIQKLSGKNYDIGKVKETVGNMLKLGFHVHGTFAFGLQGETVETIKNTIEFAKELNLTTVQFSIAVPYPGTPFFDYLKKNGYLLTENWDEYMPLRKIYEYPGLSYELMRDYLKYAYRTYYFRPRYIPIGVRQMLSQPKVFFGNFKKLVKLITAK